MSIRKIEVSAENVVRTGKVDEIGKRNNELITWINKPQLPATLDSVNFFRKPSMLYKENNDNIACSALPLIEPHWIPHEPKPPSCAFKMEPAPKPKEPKTPKEPKAPKEPRLPRGWD